MLIWSSIPSKVAWSIAMVTCPPKSLLYRAVAGRWMVNTAIMGMAIKRMINGAASQIIFNFVLLLLQLCGFDVFIVVWRTI